MEPLANTGVEESTNQKKRLQKEGVSFPWWKSISSEQLRFQSADLLIYIRLSTNW